MTKKKDLSKALGLNDRRDIRILTYDIETSPALVWSWADTFFEQGLLGVQQYSYILSIAYKWLHEDEPHILTIRDFPLYKTDPTSDRRLVEEFCSIRNEADILVAHNGRAFDEKKVATSVITHGLPPLLKIPTVDTLSMARRCGKQPSNSLKELCYQYKLGVKGDPGTIETWWTCMGIGGRAGFPVPTKKEQDEAWATMIEYNLHDVRLGELLYLTLRPHCEGLPNLANLSRDITCCPTCGGTELQVAGYHRSITMTYDRAICKTCHAVVRSIKSVKEANKPTWRT